MGKKGAKRPQETFSSRAPSPFPCPPTSGDLHAALRATSGRFLLPPSPAGCAGQQNLRFLEGVISGGKMARKPTQHNAFADFFYQGHAVHSF